MTPAPITASSGNPLIDALLMTRELLSMPSAQRASAIGVTAYDWGGSVGSPVTLTYSFIAPGASFTAIYPTQYRADIGVLPEAVKTAFQNALQAWSSVANVTFQQVQEAPGLYGDIRVGVSASNPNFPAGQNGAEAATPSSPNADLAGDVWLSPAAVSAAGWDWNASGLGYVTAIHELGHAVFNLGDVTTDRGLNGAVLPAADNFRGETVMSYSIVPGATTGQGTINQGNLSYWPTTPMVLDVLAAQWLYGANTAWHAGDDVYSFSQATTVYLTLWDGGGNDTISIAGNTRAGIIDLRPGAYSDVGSVVTASTASGTTSITRTVGIAYGATIESAIGGAGNDSLIGNDANNGLRGNAGNDMLEGGGGLDTALYNGVRASYTISQTSGSMQVRDNVGSDGTDTASGIERLRFADVIVAEDVSGNAGQAYRLYQAAFNRTPDKSGLSYWVNSLDHGSDLAAAAASFIVSDEFKAAYGDPAKLSASQFLDVLYANILGRAPDPAGKAYWQDQIEHGFARERVLASFSESSENVAIVGSRIANGIDLDPAWMT